MAQAIKKIAFQIIPGAFNAIVTFVDGTADFTNITEVSLDQDSFSFTNDVPGKTKIGLSPSFSVVQSIHKTLTAAQIITLGTVPIEIIPAPGVGKIIQVIASAARLNYNSVTFDTSATLFLGCTSLASPDASYQQTFGSILVQTANFFVAGFPNSSNVLNVKDNDSISARIKTNGTVGNSTIDIYATYMIITL
jgi:hypothetical protein